MISSLASRGHCSICHSSLFSSRKDRWEVETLGDLEGALGVNHALVKKPCSLLAWPGGPTFVAAGAEVEGDFVLMCISE